MKQFLILPAIAGAFLLASCELEEQIEPAEEAYTKAFIKEFGVIDPKQDWNMATRGSVTVNTPSATEVKVYGLVDGEYRLVGDFGGVSGSKTLEFDMPRGTENLLVSSCGMGKATSVGGTADFSGTRVASTWDGTEEGSHGVKVTKLETYKEFSENNVNSKTGVFEYRATLPEGKFNGGKVTQSFHFISDGEPFIIYPVYWQTGATPIYGISFEENGQKVHVPFYTVKDGDEMQYCVYTTSSKGIYYNNLKNIEDWPGYDDFSNFTEKDFEKLLEWIKTSVKTEIASWEDVSIKTGSYTYQNWNDTWSYSSNNSSIAITGTLNGETQYYTETFYNLTKITDNPIKNTFKNFTEADFEFVINYLKENDNDIKNGVNPRITAKADDGWSITVSYDKEGEWTDVDTGFGGDEAQSSANVNATNYKYRSRAIQITVPKDKDFCFYCTNGSYTMYSRQNWNDDVYIYADENSTNGKPNKYDSSRKGLHGASFIESEGVRCLAMEDWYYGTTGNNADCDLNDGVFYTTLATGDEEEKIIDDDKPVAYILAAEDLGNLDDFDFNDMVIEVSTPILDKETNKWKVTVKPLAAGGTLPIKLRRNGEVLLSPVDNTSEQFHAWFGDGSISTGTMINTYSFNSSLCKNTYTFEVEAKEDDANSPDFTMTSYSDDVANKMGGFSFVVDRDGDGNYTGDNETVIKAPEDGAAPQMICVPGTWKWPKERTNINVAYPEGSSKYSSFGDWCRDYTNETWVNSAVESPEPLVISH